MTHSPPAERNGSRDFDFFLGSWRTHHRRLVKRLAGCTEWAEFDGLTVTCPLLGGAGNIDDNVINLPDGTYRAATLRAYDAVLRQWSIWWLDGRRPGQLDIPVVGGFTDGIGTFYADDTLDGLPIRVRFLWLRTTSALPRWEQAFSPDGDLTWETNWTMDFARTEA